MRSVEIDARSHMVERRSENEKVVAASPDAYGAGDRGRHQKYSEPELFIGEDEARYRCQAFDDDHACLVATAATWPRVGDHLASRKPLSLASLETRPKTNSLSPARVETSDSSGRCFRAFEP